jgi:uncharacterized membrane protein
MLRGGVVVLMALDHTRDFFSNAVFNPLDLARTWPALFFTRWVTHICAPVFVLLAGMGAFLYQAQGRTKGEMARFLLGRGCLLIALEFTLVHFGWFFSFEYEFLLAQVIWAIGWSMIALAGLVFLPVWAVGLFGTVMIAGHNLFDGAAFGGASALGRLWIVLHEGGSIGLGPGRELFVLYPLAPWIGVMAAGYALGPLLLRPTGERRRTLLWLGLAMALAFVALRWSNLYGDPRPWAAQPDTLRTLMAFVNAEKYPPSLLFLLMTLGPALMLLAACDRLAETGRPVRPLLVFGRTPLFFYVAHLALIHLAAAAFSLARYGRAAGLFGTGWMFRSGLPGGYGYDLPVVYLVWVGVVVVLYPACRWFGEVKRQRSVWWLKYL